MFDSNYNGYGSRCSTTARSRALGDVVCRGGAPGDGGESGQLGRDPAGDTSLVPADNDPLVDLGTDRTATDVATGHAHTCALLNGGEVKCWGSNASGQLGQDDTQNRGLSASEMGDALLPIALGRPATQITAGFFHTCALLDDGSVKCWGLNNEGQLGLGHTQNMGDAAGEMAALPTVDLGAGRSAVAIEAGTSTCALLDNGAVKCWGGNAQGELGQGDTSARGGAPGQMGDALVAIDLGT
jgi:alpha-tubulin suppressor-like RCC1 family protein